MPFPTIAIIGLGTMGLNLALNCKDHNIPVFGYDPDPEKQGPFKQNRAGTLFNNLEPLIEALPTPRTVLLLIPDSVFTEVYLQRLLSLLNRGDLIIDAGNAHYKRTESFQQIAASNEIHYVGMGISGGAEGARNGAAIMLGGASGVVTTLLPLLTPLAAKAEDGQPCITAVGPSGSGHFVKMIHNGIEYAEMQILAELWLYLHTVCGFTPQQVAAVFMEWNQTEHSFLLETAATVLSAQDTESNTPLIEQIADHSNQKGTGQWSVMAALEYGIPAPSIAEAVFCRQLSNCPTLRDQALSIGSAHSAKRQEELVQFAHSAYIGAQLSAYTQGFSIIVQASQTEHWGVNLQQLANGWRNGCIIRGRLIEEVATAYAQQPASTHLLQMELFNTQIHSIHGNWKQFIEVSIQNQLATPVISTSLFYVHGWHSTQLGANLIEGMRDCFGGHGFSKKGASSPQHYNWQPS
ncbi:MAG: NADP-dependent phosphogluconate dehydrogenase [Gammaproteobacteria bacterium]|jgi:6-phosphogluconate dehydrogenase|nr:NADP-dependent phosphogluconate dehydrogenase [Gammaproteobacteria bacterium]MBT3717502.1 NADP-dependent phosphogluconate dehydrogenase [Gammaproteobacteria bacterium]MBT3844655.1 NADP-dependent phosphogluconate dehydrogenase [Gammaproteobacteria bacterium]MBT4299681.1 NADP-dependent phosphogluconate dehydrogenase [Gammaproteobacteria bacterium]MBT5372167.1 NADP-dependent phosphogluconate dehydrogenase [Gammaproteobacteria bacterium]